MASLKQSRRTVLKALGAGVLGAATAPLLAGCAATPAPGGDQPAPTSAQAVEATAAGAATQEQFKIELLVEYPEEFLTWAADNIVPAIKEMHPVSDVNYIPIDWATLGEKLLTGRAAGTMPDVIRGGSGDSLAYSEDDADYALCVDDYVAQWPDKEDFYAASWEAVVWKGKNYGIPVLGGPRHWCYRSDITAEEGITIPDDWDWDDFMDSAVKLTTFDGNKVVRKGSSTGHDEMEFTGLLYSAGGSLFKNGKSNFLSDEGIWALQWMVDRRQQIAPPSVAPLESMEIPYFAMGLEVIAYGHPGIHGKNVLKYAPDKIEFVAVPQPPIKQKRVALVSTDWDAVSKTCKHPQAVWDYMTLQCSTEAMTVAQEAYGGFPPTRRSVVDAAQYTKRQDVKKATENLDAYGLNYPVTPAGPLRRPLLLSECESAVLGVKTAEEALTDAAAEWDKELERIGWTYDW